MIEVWFWTVFLSVMIAQISASILYWTGLERFKSIFSRNRSSTED
ncbi:MAG: hypothetical protein AB7F86_17820 [Bdellovibrionales bacterium]